MRKLTLFILGCVMSVVALGQPELMDHITFENGIPAGWTVSSNSNVMVTDLVASTGEKCVRMKPSSTASVMLTSPVYNVTANTGVRLEFSHIPILGASANLKGKLQIKVDSGEWLDLNNGGNSQTSPGDLDRTYGCGDPYKSNFEGFGLNYHWSTYFKSDSTITTTQLVSYLNDEESKYYGIVDWRNAVFYLANKLGTTGTSFQLRFVIQQFTAASASNFEAGWFIDDIRLYKAQTPGDEVRIPQINSRINCPDMLNYPVCSDLEVLFDIRDNNGALSSIEDSIYIEYYREDDPTLQRVNFEQVTNTQYRAMIPYPGVNAVIYWRAVINDHKGNVTTYPFAYNRYNKTRAVIPFVGNPPLVESGTSSQSIMINTSLVRAKYQMIYRASELKEAGYGAGKIDGLYVNFTEAPAGTNLTQFKMSIGLVPPTTAMDTFNPMSGLTMVMMEPVLVMPPVGWYYFAFDPQVNFIWDGHSDIVVSVCNEGKTGSGTSKLECIPVTKNTLAREISVAGSIVEACLGQFPDSPWKSYKPNMRFNFVNTCFFQFDAAIDRTQILKPNNAITCEDTMLTTGFCTLNQPAELKVNLKNEGTEPLHRIYVKYMLDDNPATMQTTTYQGTLQPGASFPYTITNNFLPPVGEHTLKVWTEMYDADTIDWNYMNDTATFTILVSEGALNGTYAIGNNVEGVTAQRTFSSFDKAFLMLINSGVSGPVVMKIQNIEHLYDTFQLAIPTCINGLSATNTLTFEGVGGKPIFFSGDTLAPALLIDGVSHLRFKNLRFRNNGIANANVIRVNTNSSDIKFIGCDFATFGEALGYSNSGEKINSMININAADDIEIDSCTFQGAANNQVYISGFSPVQPLKNVNIKNSTFSISQDNNGVNTFVTGSSIFAQYAKNLAIENNRFTTNYNISPNHNYSTVNYAVSLLGVKTQIERNTFILEGVSAMSLSQVDSSRIANNRISLNRYVEGSAYITYGINFLAGNKDTIAFNDVYARSLSSYDKRAIGMSLGSNIACQNNSVKNNIVVSDGYGFAMVVKPVGPCQDNFDISNNLYYKTTSVEGMPLLSYNGSTSTTIQQWMNQTSDANSYYDQDPIFYSWDSLFTTSTFLCAKGVAIPGITKDYLGNDRPTNSNPCIGSREFLPPTSNVFVMATGILSGNFDGVDRYTGCDLSTEQVFVTFKNLSADTIPAASSVFKYKVNNGSTVSATLPYDILPDSIYNFTFPTTASFVTTGNSDTEYSLKTWSAIVADTINDNDTATASIISLYQLPALATQNQNVNYGADADLTINSTDSIYWYINIDDDQPVLKSNTFHTPVLYHDTMFYFSRKSEIPYVRIAEFQLSKANTAAGLTANLPSYVSSNNAVELTNFGNGDLDMTGYKMYYSKAANNASEVATSGSNFKSYSFPAGYVLKAGKSVILVNATSVPVADSVALATSVAASFITQTNKGAVILLDANNTVVDAVAINGATFPSSLNVSGSVWSSSNSLTVSGSPAASGVYRTAHTPTGWQVSSASNPMTVGTYNSNLQKYFDNGCYGDKSIYNVTIVNAPTTDIAILDVKLAGYENDTSSCAMGLENVVVKMTNSGLTSTTTAVPLICNVYNGTTLTQTFTENYTPILAPFDTVIYTLQNTIDLSSATSDNNFRIEIVVDLEEEVINFNDTMSMNFTALQTPVLPVTTDVDIPYASSTTISAQSDDLVVWYADETTDVELARGTYTTPTLYETTTYYAAAILNSNQDGIIGEGTTMNTASGYPGPFNCAQKHVKEQYLFLASELNQMGLTEGNINSIAFNIGNVTVGSGQTAAMLYNYNVKLTTTSDDVIASWVGNLTPVYYADQLSFATADIGWQTLQFETPYYWDGQSNLVVEICFEATVTSSKVRTYMTSVGFNATRSYRNASTDACTFQGNPSSTYTDRPNIKFNFNKLGCASSRTPMTVNILPGPTCEAAVEQINEPSDAIVMSGIDLPIEVKIKNYGSENLTSATIYWSVNNETPTAYSWTGNLAEGQSEDVQVGTYNFSSGAIDLKVYIVKDCDTIHSNDTVQIQFSACLGNNTSTTEYLISATDANADFTSLSAVIDALNESGVCGPVVFNIAAGTYTEQLLITDIQGASLENTITFQAADPTNKPIIINTATANETDAALVLRGGKNIYFNNLEIQAGSATSQNVVELTNTENISFTNMDFLGQGITATTLMSLGGQNNNIVIENNTFHNAKDLFVSAAVPVDSLPNNLTINNNIFTYFASSAVSVGAYNNLTISNNIFRAYNATIEGKAITVSNISGVSVISGNDIFVNESNKVRYGINVKRSTFTMMNPLLIYNNSVSMNGVTTTAAVNSMGIDIDSSIFVNVYYNTVRVNSSAKSEASVAMRVGAQANNIIVRNNNFENAAKGFAYYINSANAVTLSNNNNYFTTGTKFAYWGTAMASLTALQTANAMDEASVSVVSPFESDSVLKTQYPTDIVYGAEPVEEVNVDILGNTRPVSPKPTMGAYEYIFAEKDAGITEIIDPVNTQSYIEGEPTPLTVKIKNFGSYSCANINIVANLKTSADGTILQTINGVYTPTLVSMEEVAYTFASSLVPPLNDPYTDSLYLEVYTQLTDDTITYNDTASVNIKVIPAYNLYVKKTNPVTERCRLYEVPISMEIQNKGEKAVDNSHTVYVSYIVDERPDVVVTEQIQFPYLDPDYGYIQSLQKNASMTYTFNQKANLYPLGTTDEVLHVRTYVSFDLDHVPVGTNSNDTSAAIIVNSRVSPVPPVVYDDEVFYGTIGHPYAEHENNLAIKWFYSTNDPDPFYAPSNYNTSKTYTTPDRVLQDLTYYVRVNLTGSYPCASDFVPIKVKVKDRLPVDMAGLNIVGPTYNPTSGAPNGLVYTESDTVSMKIVNYGTQNATNFEVSYEIKQGTNGEVTTITETCYDVVAPDQEYVYKFQTLAPMPTSNTYYINGYVKATGDIVESNDTVYSNYQFKPTNGNTIYGSGSVNNGSSLDIVRVQLGTMDNASIAGDDTYSDFTQSVVPTVLFKGTKDSLIVHTAAAPSMDEELTTTDGWMKVYIDWNRDGVFDPVAELVYSDTVDSQTNVNATEITVPLNNVSGKTRMRVMVQQYKDHEFEPTSALPKGEIEDYVVEIMPMYDVNAQMVKLVSPERFVSEQSQDLKIRLKNVGANNLTNATINYSINGHELQTYQWTGSLATSEITDITLSNATLDYGNNNILAYVVVTGDGFPMNDTINASVFCFRTFTLSYSEDFDNEEVLNEDFYPYESNPNQPTNCWQMGTPGPENNIITSAYSEPYCWKTNIDGKYPAKNHSILYTPMYNIEYIKPDTIAFMLRTALGSAKLSVEYLDYKGNWKRIGSGDDSLGYNWYNSEDGFTGNNSTWKQVYYSMKNLASDMGTIVQFRFVFKSGAGTTSEGAAIDNFEVRRALRPQDPGVVDVELTPLLLPNYGSNFYPKVTIHNFGTEPLSQVRVCYMSEDMHIPVCEEVYLMDTPIEPFDNYEYIFQQGHYLDVSMPDPFLITAFTRNSQDLYTDNDTARAMIVIGPLEKDAALLAIESPDQQIVSNDDVEIGIRIRNYGLTPITELPVAYQIGSMVVNEVIDFNPPLYNGDEYVYKFQHRYHAPYGTVNLKAWVGLVGDYYHDNDTLFKRLEGTNYTQDIEARYITIDDDANATLGVQLAFLNRSSRGVGNIRVGYYYDNDPTTAFEEDYRQGNVLPAGDYGYHYFSRKLPRRVYQSICAYVIVPNEVDVSNDTTYTIYIGYRDAVADSIYIEETVADDCKIQLVGHNNGTLGGNVQVKAYLRVNGGAPIMETFTWEYDEPNPRLTEYMTFQGYRIPKSADHTYDVVAWIEYPYDINHSNDTTRAYAAKTYVGIEQETNEISESGFILEQNNPNPLQDETQIGFTLPQAGMVHFYITNSIGQVVYSMNDNYNEGHHYINFNAKDLEEGAYYYVMTFNGEKQMKKMIIVR